MSKRYIAETGTLLADMGGRCDEMLLLKFVLKAECQNVSVMITYMVSTYNIFLVLAQG